MSNADDDGDHKSSDECSVSELETSTDDNADDTHTHTQEQKSESVTDHNIYVV